MKQYTTKQASVLLGVSNDTTMIEVPEGLTPMDILVLRRFDEIKKNLRISTDRHALKVMLSIYTENHTKDQRYNFSKQLESLLIKRGGLIDVESSLINVESSPIDKYCYILKNNRNGMYKIGYSKHPFVRESTLQSEDPDITMVKVFESNHESELHEKYKEHRVRGEWFDLTRVQVKYICTHYK